MVRKKFNIYSSVQFSTLKQERSSNKKKITLSKLN